MYIFTFGTISLASSGVTCQRRDSPKVSDPQKVARVKAAKSGSDEGHYFQNSTRDHAFPPFLQVLLLRESLYRTNITRPRTREHKRTIFTGDKSSVGATLPRGVLKKVLYGEAPPRGPTPYPFIYHFFRKGIPFVYLLLEKGTPFIYLLMNKSLKQEVFLSFFSHSA